MVQPLPRTDLNRLAGCLNRLVPHVQRDRVAITGGVAMQIGMAGIGRAGPRNHVADLDLVTASIDAISRGVTKQFLVSHYHVVQPGVPKFMIQLVDPLSRIRIDIFPDLVGSLMDARPTPIGGHTFQVLPLERIFEHKVQTLRRASPSAPIDPKHVRDAQALGEILGRQTPVVLPEAIAVDVYGIDDCSCRRCELSSHPAWPLALKEQIFQLLGWNGQSHNRLQPAVPRAMMSGRGKRRT